MANYEFNKNMGPGGGTGGESSQGDKWGPPRADSYKDFMKCNLKSFYRNEGVVGLTYWIAKMEFVFEISFYAEGCKAKMEFVFEI